VNLGVDAASGDVVILLNNDVVARSAGWVEELVGHARRPEVGAVGALLSYPDGAVQHAGVIVGFNGIAEHAFREWRSTADGYLGLLRSTRRVSAVTGACMAIRRGVLIEAGGLDEGSLPVELNDIDLCLRLDRTGLITIWTPHAHLVHLESASRGAAPSAARSRAVEQQRSAFLGRWRTTIEDDAAYHPMLAREGIPYLLGDG
jgi:GT2 family glycosyltransferase